MVQSKYAFLGGNERFKPRVTSEEFQGAPVVQHPDVWHYLSLIFENNDLSIDVNKLLKGPYINQIDQILLPVSKGIGYTALPIHAVSSSKYGELVKILNKDNVVMQNIYLIKKKHVELPSRYATVIEITKECIENTSQI